MGFHVRVVPRTLALPHSPAVRRLDFAHKASKKHVLVEDRRRRRQPLEQQ